MIDAKETKLRGLSAIVTSAPFTAVPGDEPRFTDLLMLGDDVLILDREVDPHGNVAVWFEGRPAKTFRLAAACLTVLNSHALHVRPAAVEFITRDVAAHVLYVFTGNGYAPGSYIRALIDAAARADMGHKRILEQVYPGYVSAVRLAQGHPQGIDVLRQILRNDVDAANRILQRG